MSILLALAVATASPSQLAERLVASGYEHVVVQRGADTMIAFEDRLHSEPALGLGEVARLALVDGALERSLTLVLRHEGQGLLAVRMGAEALAGFMAGSMASEAFAASLEFLDPPRDLPRGESPTAGKLDLALVPGYRFDTELVGELRPTVRWSLRDDLLFRGRVRARVYPGFGVDGGAALLESDRALAPGLWAGWLLGMWEPTRVGAMGSVGGLWGPLSWNLLGTAVTGMPIMARLASELPLPWWDGFVRLGGGWYALGDPAAFLGVGRYLGRSQLEASVFASPLGAQLRASLTTYLGPARRPDPGSPRIEFPGELALDYRAIGAPAGTELYPQPEVVRRFERLEPGRLRRQIMIWRAATR